MTPKLIARLLVLGVVALPAAACTVPFEAAGNSQAHPGLAKPPGEADDMAKLIYLAAQTLSERSELLSKTQPIIVATFVSVDDLKSTSTFGKLASELVADRIQQRGFLVRDVTYMGALETSPNTGELVLSREARKMSDQFDAQAVVAGTYAVAGTEIYLNLRLLRAERGEKQGEVLSSVDIAIPLDANTETLIGAQRGFAPTPYDQYAGSGD